MDDLEILKLYRRNEPQPLKGSHHLAACWRMFKAGQREVEERLARQWFAQERCTKPGCPGSEL